MQAKHTVQTPIKEGDIRNLLLASLADLKTGSMFDPEIFANIIIEDVDIVSMHREISPIYNKLEETSDSDEFLARFMGRIARNSSKYGTNFSSPAFTYNYNPPSTRYSFYLTLFFFVGLIG